MKLVIDIDENLYTRLFDNGSIDALDMLKACIAIRKGTPLPKEYEKIKDIDKIISDEIKKFYDWYNEMEYADNMRYVDAIIKADKTESEKEWKN